MKLKKVVSALLVGTMLISTVACGGGNNSSNTKADAKDGNAAGTESSSSGDSKSDDTASGDKQKLVVWTKAKDLETFAAKYMEDNPNVEVETVVIEPADYVTKIQTALNGGSKDVDVFVGEPQDLGGFYEAGYFEDLNQAPYNAQEYEGQIVDYIWDVGQDAEGIQRAISYQITPAGMFYRRSIALDAFGTDDPDEIGKLFKDYPTILETAKTLKEKGYRIFASDGEMNVFSGQEAWVVDGTLNVADSRTAYMDLCVQLYQQDLTAFANQWSTPWYQAMAGEVPVLPSDGSVDVWNAEEFEEATAGLETTSVFAFGLPSWGVLTIRDNCGDTTGDWGVCSGPAYGFDGGTFMGISAQSEAKELAWDFLKYCTLDQDVSEWWIEKSQGDAVSLVSSLEKHADDENAVYGNEKLYSFWLKQSEGIDYSKVTKYDQAIKNAWGNAINVIKTGEKSKEEAIDGFYDEVQSTYPEITINR